MTFCPTTPSLRFIQKLAPLPVKPKLRKLSQCITVAQGRSKGQIVLRHRGGLCKSRFPLVLKDRSSFFFPTYIVNFIKTPSSKPFVALIKNPQGVLSYISIPHGLGVGTFLYTAIGQSLTTIKATGVFTWITSCQQGDTIVNILTKTKVPYSWARAAGTKCTIKYLSFNKDFYMISIPSGKQQKLPTTSFVTIGQNSNLFHKKEVVGCAGRNRKLGVRPAVRGVAMNPVDHPHGGRTKTSQPEVSPWGWVTKFNH